jgi:hypothetical protein
MNPLFKTLLWISIFSIAMGFLESSVVVYLRKLYYPGGFRFPLTVIPSDIATVEFFREAATIIMLLGAGILAGRNTSQRLAFFVYAFALWDVFYYIFLKLILHWPESFQTWDILFLIPVPWVGPVLAPCIVSLTMIGLTLVILLHSDKGFQTRLRITEWLLLSTGSLIIIYSFCSDYLHKVLFSAKHGLILNDKADLFSDMKAYVPEAYNWQTFSVGEIMLMVAIIVYVMRLRKKEQIGIYSPECYSERHHQSPI